MSLGRALEDLPGRLDPRRDRAEQATDAALAFALRARLVGAHEHDATGPRAPAAEPPLAAPLAAAVAALTREFNAEQGLDLALRAMHRIHEPQLHEAVRAMLRRVDSDKTHPSVLDLVARILAPALRDPHERLLIVDATSGLDAASLVRSLRSRNDPGGRSLRSRDARPDLSLRDVGRLDLELASDLNDRERARLLVTSALLGSPAAVLARPPLGSHLATYAAVRLRKGALSRLENAIRVSDALRDGGRGVVRLPTSGPLSDQRSLDDRKRLLAHRAVAAVLALPTYSREIGQILLVLAPGRPSADVLFLRPDTLDPETPPIEAELHRVAASAIDAHIADEPLPPTRGLLRAVVSPDTLHTSRALLAPERWVRPAAPTIAEAAEGLANAERDERDAATRVTAALTALSRLT